jgi:hypothetical protein
MAEVGFKLGVPRDSATTMGGSLEPPAGETVEKLGHADGRFDSRGGSQTSQTRTLCGSDVRLWSLPSDSQVRGKFFCVALAWSAIFLIALRAHHGKTRCAQTFATGKFACGAPYLSKVNSLVVTGIRSLGHTSVPFKESL